MACGRHRKACSAIKIHTALERTRRWDTRTAVSRVIQGSAT
jgi:hypothetical protein